VSQLLVDFFESRLYTTVIQYVLFVVSLFFVAWLYASRSRGIRKLNIKKKSSMSNSDVLSDTMLLPSVSSLSPPQIEPASKLSLSISHSHEIMERHELHELNKDNIAYAHQIMLRHYRKSLQELEAMKMLLILSSLSKSTDASFNDYSTETLWDSRKRELFEKADYYHMKYSAEDRPNKHRLHPFPVSVNREQI